MQTHLWFNGPKPVVQVVQLKVVRFAVKFQHGFHNFPCPLVMDNLREKDMLTSQTAVEGSVEHDKTKRALTWMPASKRVRRPSTNSI